MLEDAAFVETMASATKRVVTLKFEDLVAGKDLTEEIYEAYGPDGLGALTISGIPEFLKQREQLLPLGYDVRRSDMKQKDTSSYKIASPQLAHIPQEKLAKLEDAESLWNAGWSYGREKLGDDADTSKGRCDVGSS